MKCCDNCKYNAKETRESKRNTHYLCRELGEQLWRENWDTSKDFCSKWEEKEDNASLLVGDISKTCHTWEDYNNNIEYVDINDVVEYFKQRIQESLEKADKETRESLLDITKNSFGLINTVKKHLGWILD